MNIKTAIANLDEVITKIEGARLRLSHHHIVKLIGVSKYSSAEDVEKLYEAGQRAYGENKVQDLRDKKLALDEHPLEWHFIGSLQKNKINNLIDAKPTLMHSLDSIELANELNKKLEVKNTTMKCLLQVNAAGEESKSGVNPLEAVSIYKTIIDTCPNIKLLGIMSIGAHSEDRKVIKKSFKDTKAIFDELSPLGAKYCSMGMSSDFELAIECGSNMIRVGSALFKD